MSVLFFNVPCNVYDRTLHYYQATFSAVAGYLQERFPESQVVVEAGGLRGATLRTLVRHLADVPSDSVLFLWTRVWEAPATLELARLAREIQPHLRIIAWGDGPIFMPQYFRRQPFDGFLYSGDPETVLGDALQAWNQGESPTHGLELDGTRLAVGTTLDPAQWPYPRLEWLDPLAYRSAREDRGKLTDDLSFTISRGCPINCAPWCSTPRKEGLRDRRRSAQDTARYMLDGSHPYEMFQLHSPLFAQDREWIEQFVKAKRQLCPDVPFKSVDLMNPYSEERLVADLASVGMRGVGFGVETFSARGKRLAPKADERKLEQIARLLQRYGIQGKAYTQLGLPGQTRDDIYYTHNLLLDLGLQPRPTGATPFGRLARMSVEELDALDLSRWDRKSFYSPTCGLTPQEFYQLVLGCGKEVVSWAA